MVCLTLHLTFAVLFSLLDRLAGTQADIPTICTEREVAERSILIKNMMEDVGDAATAEAIPIPNVCSQVEPNGTVPGLRAFVHLGQCHSSQESNRVVSTPPRRSPSFQRGRFGFAQENYRHRGVGSKVHASGPGDAVRDHSCETFKPFGDF